MLPITYSFKFASATYAHDEGNGKMHVLGFAPSVLQVLYRRIPLPTRNILTYDSPMESRLSSENNRRQPL